ncbi:regulatory helix-turn-helix LysR family protein [Loktanella sp. PT4BL]|nr:regulatory helix-turn-helix LysR family protein [Loktanella sp. PT4BL]
MYQSKNNTGVTVDMLRAFVCLSRHLNLSKASDELGTTRQTVRRHITDLEVILEQKLFEVVDRQYELTPEGSERIEEAQKLILQLDSWAGQSALTKKTKAGLEKLEYTDKEGRSFHSQQHPVSQIAINGLPLMKSALMAWGNAKTQIEHEAMDEIRPYMVLFRKVPAGWVFVHVGKESAYARWFGWTWASSAIGKLINEDNVGDEYNEFIGGAYSRIYEEGGVRLDHIFAHLPKDGGQPHPGTFQRLLLGGVFPDGTPGLILMASITEQVEIDALSEADRPKIDADMIMDTLPALSNSVTQLPQPRKASHSIL